MSPTEEENGNEDESDCYCKKKKFIMPKSGIDSAFEQYLFLCGCIHLSKKKTKK